MRYNSPWTRPKELKQADYALQSLPQRVKLPKAGAHHGVSKGHGIHGHPQSQHPSALCRLHLLSLVWKGGVKMREPWLTI